MCYDTSKGVMIMLFSIPPSYMDDIQNKLDLGLIINYRLMHYEGIVHKKDEIRTLYNKHYEGKKIFFYELSALDSVYDKVIEDIKQYIENDFTEMLKKEKDFKELKARKANAWKVQRNRWKKNVTVRKKGHEILKIIKNDRTEEEWLEKYKCYTLDEYILRLDNQTKEWAKNKDFFYRFPYFDYLTEKQRKSGLQYDLDRNILELLEQEVLIDYYISKPTYLSDTPIYTQKKEQIKMIDDNGVLKAEKQTGDDLKVTYYTIPNEKISIPENPDYGDGLEIMKTLDAVDNELTDYIMTKIIESGENLYAFAKATFSLNELSTKVLKWHGSSGIDNVRKRLLNLVRPITYSDGKNEIAVTLFDSCFITEDEKGKQIATLAAGVTFKEAYIKNQLIYVARKQYERLQCSLSKHLCYNLQRDRVGLASFNQPLEKEYDLNYFNRIIQFGTTDKKYKFEVIQKSLDEFVQMEFLVKEYEITKRGFLVTFLPFTEAEWKDLKNVRKQKVIDTDAKEIKDIDLIETKDKN